MLGFIDVGFDNDLNHRVPSGDPMAMGSTGESDSPMMWKPFMKYVSPR
jgi:hypothetical protein